MFDKDEEIDRLNLKISALMAQIPNTLMDSERTTVQLLNKVCLNQSLCIFTRGAPVTGRVI